MLADGDRLYLATGTPPLVSTAESRDRPRQAVGLLCLDICKQQPRKLFGREFEAPILDIRGNGSRTALRR
jgi:hypothetical protein